MIKAISLLVLVVGLVVAGASVRETPAPEVNPLHPPIVRLYDIATARFFCSGTVISPKLIVSAAHCMYDHPEGIEVRNMFGKPVGALVLDLRAHERSDQALLFGDFHMFRIMQIVEAPADVLKLAKRNNLEACGFPYAGPMFCTDLKYKGIDVFQFKGAGNAWPGMSGGPVFDKKTGFIIAVITAMNGDDMIVSPTVNIFYNLGLREVK